MSNNQGHLLHYKNEKGEWVALPYAIINVYDTYVAYCHEQGIEPVSASEYYVTLGNLKTYVDQLAGSSENIAALTEALKGGTLPVSLGGTGQGFSNAAELIGYIYDQLRENHDVVINDELKEVEDTMLVALNGKVNRAAFSSGTADPDATTQGEFYFQFKA